MLDRTLLVAAAEAAADVYGDNKNAPPFEHLRTVEQFRPVGELRCGVRSEHNGRTAIVAVRGTEGFGNWIFTNFQAYFAPLRLVDDALSVASPSKYQGGSYRTPASGTIHQGFFRAFSWLWYGTEPMMDRTERSEAAARIRLRRYLAICFALPSLVWLFFAWVFVGTWSIGSAAIAALVALTVPFIFITFEDGIWEDLFKDHPQVAGGALSTPALLQRLNAYDCVVFTGHSLGGSVATIMFLVYRCWCRSDAARSDNGYLVTFGSPRVGDVPFVTEFCRQHPDRFVHFIHPGDPVPQLPPNGLDELRFRRTWRRGWLGRGVCILFPAWAGVARLYRFPRPARWSDTVIHRVTEPATQRLKIGHHSMRRVYLPFVRSLG